MKRIVLDCSSPEKDCEWCIFNGHDGCRAPMRLRDCYTEHGVWQVEEVKDEGDGK